MPIIDSRFGCAEGEQTNKVMETDNENKLNDYFPCDSSIDEPLLKLQKCRDDQLKERQADRLAQNFTQTENERDSISFNQDVAPEHLNSYQQNFNKDRANLIEINNSLDTHSESGKTNDVSEFKKCHTIATNSRHKTSQFLNFNQKYFVLAKGERAEYVPIITRGKRK